MLLVHSLSGEGLSRARIQGLISSGRAVVNGEPRKSGYRLRPDDLIAVTIPPPEPVDLIPQQVNFDLLYEDKDILVISKPPGIVVHPAASYTGATLVHGLLHQCQDLSGINGKLRPGIVHRLDKDTSGLMVVAKNDQALKSLVEQFKARLVGKVYLALVVGRPVAASGEINQPIGRHPVQRKKMAVTLENSREARTAWKILRYYPNYTLLELTLHTGRTHQIRVHMAHLGYPVAGDTVYGRRTSPDDSVVIARQLLHAFSLSFSHPVTAEKLRFVAPLPEDFSEVLSRLEACGNDQP